MLVVGKKTVQEQEPITTRSETQRHSAYSVQWCLWETDIVTNLWLYLGTMLLSRMDTGEDP